MDKDFLKVSPFILSQNHYLFFDIFYKNSLIYIIAPIYHSNFPDFSLIKIFQDNSQLEVVNTLIRDSYEPICIIIYKPHIASDVIDLNVCYHDMQKHYNLKNYTSTKTDQLVQTTLCLHDMYLFPMFYDYHIKMGIQKFYIYYNGVVTDEIRNKINRDNVYLIEWNFHYYNTIPRYYQHHAQPGQMHHALYKYGKDMTEYMLFNDLDEYVYIKNGNLQNLMDKKTDMILLFNAWSKLDNNSIPTSFPNTFLTTDPVHYERSKCIYKTDTVELILVHYVSKFTYTHIGGHSDIWDLQNNILLHFFNWSQPKRIISDRTFYEITL
jgi:hypothetical protein